MALSRVHELGNFIRDQRRNARLSLRKMSDLAGISNPYLSQIERGLRKPSAEILQSIAKALRISSETLYVKAGILEETKDAVDPMTALLRDHSITEKQRQVLIQVYQSFRHENELAGTTATVVPIKARAPKKAAAARKPAARKPAARKPATRKPATARKAKTTRKPAARVRSKAKS